LLSTACSTLSAQETLPPPGSQIELEEEVKFYNGLSISADLFGVGNKVFGADYISSEVGIEANLKNRFFPVFEAGFGSSDAWNEDKDIHYKAAAPFFRLGMNYNTMYKKGSRNYLYVGARYGISIFNYDVRSLSDGEYDNPRLVDYIWKESLPFNYSGLSATIQWFEIVTGVKAHIWKNVSMGWSIRLRYRLSSSISKHGNPWYVPGFGKYDSNIGMTYTIAYKLPF